MAGGLLAGRVGLVTGGGSGIGRATALRFAAEGARVVVADRNADSAQSVASEIVAAGGEALAVVADVSDDAMVQAMVQGTLARFGRLDCAFNNAGIGAAELGAAGQKLGEMEEAAFDRLVAINLKGVWLCLKHELGAMQGGGAIVNTASIGGLIGLPGSGVYTATKHAVIGLTRAAAVEYGPRGIRVNAVCPGYIETPLTVDTLSRRADAIRPRLPLQRVGQAEEVAALVAWLCSDQASYVSGAAYTADGGYTAG
ncbi:SDR family NAD(P)-dependent oxidoreductase [Zavarzinia sp. CC-PAN008]|uniref:SDR family NAD(P)-dependent oxidoreductase n=1 Tax=Zavarzinia sp. CC-PAN008 TaxID=3243332 RepID=UPI003F746D34